MARRRIINAKNTTIAVDWNDKERFRRHAEYVKNTKSGQRSESDLVLFKKMVDFYEEHHKLPENAEPKTTYPTKVSQEHDQQD